jgi:acetyl esterase/lipase
MIEFINTTKYQPLHPSIRDQLNPEYVTFHEEILQYVSPAETKDWTPLLRLRPSPLARGSQQRADVGSICDHELDTFQVRVFNPVGTVPKNGWPALVWLHGGGWVNGGLNSENGFLTHVCKCRLIHTLLLQLELIIDLDVDCVVLSINYRHAPEHAYPAAIDDAFAGLKWILSPEKIADLKLDPARIALGGLSA